MFDFDKFRDEHGNCGCWGCPYDRQCTEAYRDPENDEPAPCERWKKEKLLRRLMNDD